MRLRVVEGVESLGFSVEGSGELLGESWCSVLGAFGGFWGNNEEKCGKDLRMCLESCNFANGNAVVEFGVSFEWVLGAS
jgi:hypothetical protein